MQPSVVVIGGGTGNFSVLSGLKDRDLELTAVVAMSDSGGSSGRLRDELGQLPPEISVSASWPSRAMRNRA